MTNPEAPRIKDRERTAILQSLRAGVVPKVGLQHIQVGRKSEVAAILRDLDVAKDGGAAVRFVVGRYGSGKSFFLNLASIVALEKGFLVARADLTLDRRLHGTGGQSRALVTELMKNLSSKARPDGSALGGVLDRWISNLVTEVADETRVESQIMARLKPLQDLVNGFDFAAVVARYFRAYQSGDEATQQNALRWLRAEYPTKTDARKDLGVRSIVGDAEVYDHLKLLAKFARIAGYSGLVICIDEVAVLSHRLPSARARAANYEQFLRIVNDALQGSVEGMFFVFGATDEALEDRRRGLYSYEALATRLAPNEFARGDVNDLSGPVIRLRNLQPEDLFVLLHRIRDVFAYVDPNRYLIPDEGLKLYIDYCAQTLGDAYFKTPRDTVIRFVGLLSVIDQDPAHDWRAPLRSVNDVHVEPTQSSEVGGVAPDADDDLETFKL